MMTSIKGWAQAALVAVTVLGCQGASTRGESRDSVQLTAQEVAAATAAGMKVTPERRAGYYYLDVITVDRVCVVDVPADEAPSLAREDRHTRTGAGYPLLACATEGRRSAGGR
jgi:hypothetical protein